MENQSLCRPTRRLLGRRPTKNTNCGREKTAGKNNNEEEGAWKGGVNHMVRNRNVTMGKTHFEKVKRSIMARGIVDGLMNSVSFSFVGNQSALRSGGGNNKLRY